jgi:hypothetical protein
MALVIVLTNQTSSMEHSLIENLTVAQILQNLAVFYVTRGFIVVFTTACHLSLSSVTRIIPSRTFLNI